MYIWRPGQLPIGQTAKARSGYRVQSLRMGRGRQSRCHLICPTLSGLVKMAPLFSLRRAGLTKCVLCQKVSGRWLRTGGGDCGLQRPRWSTPLTVLQCDQTTRWATPRIMCREEVGQSLQGLVRFVLRVRFQHGNSRDRSAGTFSARRRWLGIFALAAVTPVPGGRPQLLPVQAFVVNWSSVWVRGQVY